MKQLKEQVKELPAQLRREAVQKLVEAKAVGVRFYAENQPLIVRIDDKWRDATVCSGPASGGGGNHELRLGETSSREVSLHPWNHAPRGLTMDDFDSILSRYIRRVQADHACVVDALSGQRLNVLEQCVPIRMHSAITGDAGPASLGKVRDVQALAVWLSKKYEALVAGDADERSCILLTGQPAAGKTCLMSRLVMHTLEKKPVMLVPILVKIQQLQRRLGKDEAKHFETSWNWVDAYLRYQYGVDSELYAMLRQAMMARRALLLLDGLDEGGNRKGEIERHITEVLALQVGDARCRAKLRNTTGHGMSQRMQSSKCW